MAKYHSSESLNRELHAHVENFSRFTKAIAQIIENLKQILYEYADHDCMSDNYIKRFESPHWSERIEQVFNNFNWLKCDEVTNAICRSGILFPEEEPEYCGGVFKTIVALDALLKPVSSSKSDIDNRVK